MVTSGVGSSGAAWAKAGVAAKAPARTVAAKRLRTDVSMGSSLITWGEKLSLVPPAHRGPLSILERFPRDAQQACTGMLHCTRELRQRRDNAVDCVVFASH